MELVSRSTPVAKVDDIVEMRLASSLRKWLWTATASTFLVSSWPITYWSRNSLIARGVGVGGSGGTSPALFFS